MKTAQIRPYFLLILLLGSAILSLLILRPFLITLILAVICSVVVYPLHNFLLRKTNNRRSLSAILTLCIVCLVLLIPLQFVGTRVFSEVQNVYISLTTAGSGGIQAPLQKVGSSLERFIPGANAYISSYSQNIDEYFQQFLKWSVGNLGGFFSGLSHFAIQLFIFFMAVYYLLVEGKQLREHVIHWSPLDDTDDTLLLRKVAASIKSVIWGSIGVAFIQAVCATIGFTIFGMPNAILWGFVTLFAALVPSAGTGLVFVPAVIYLFITDHTGGAIGLAIWGAVFVGTIDNFISPLLSGRGTKLNPLITLLSVFGGLSFFGFAGVFLGPIAVSFFFSLFAVYKASMGNKETGQIV